MPASVQNPANPTNPADGAAYPQPRRQPRRQADAGPGPLGAGAAFPDALDLLSAQDALIALHAAFSNWSITHTPDRPVPWAAQRIRTKDWTGGAASWEATSPGRLALMLTDAARLEADAEERR